MVNAYTLGFAGVLAFAGLGVDFHQQSLRAGVGMTEFGPGAYVATFSGRFDEMLAERAAAKVEDARARRWRAGGLEFLPEAPEGWTRRSFLDGDNSAITIPAGTLQTSRTSVAALPLITKANARDSEKEAKDLAKRSWVYQRGEETVFVEVRTKDEVAKNSLTGIVAATMDGMAMKVTQLQGYAVVGGVGFIEALDANGQRPSHYRVLRATIGLGQEIHLKVHANASIKSTREILDAIDYDGLNALLTEPLDTVGNDITPTDQLPEWALAARMEDLRNEFLNLRMREAQEKIENIDPAAMMLNSYAEGVGLANGVVDMTGGKVVDMSTLINLGYRKGLSDLLQGHQPDGVVTGLGTVMDAAAGPVPHDIDGATTDPSNTQQATAAAPAASAMQRTDTGQMSEGMAREALLYYNDAVVRSVAKNKANVAAVAIARAQADTGKDGLLDTLTGVISGNGTENIVASPAARAVENTTKINLGNCGAGQFCKAGN